MTKFVLLSTSLAATLAVVLLPAAPAQAQLLTTWVASNGADSGTCGFRSSPCNSFNGAYNRTSAGGEIKCVDSGHYTSGLVITKSITINCGNAIGSVPVALIEVTTSATDVVILRGLDFDGGGTFCGGCGLITFSGAGVLHVDNVKINNLLSGNGIRFVPTGAAKLFVSDSQITNNGGTGVTAGIYIKPASGVLANVMIERSRINNNLFGIIADGTGGGTIRGVVQDSVVSGNINNGITASTSGSVVNLAVDNTTVAGSTNGLVTAGTNASMLVSRSFITGNATGLLPIGASALYSYRDNRVNGNTTTDGAFTAIIGTQ